MLRGEAPLILGEPNSFYSEWAIYVYLDRLSRVRGDWIRQRHAERHEIVGSQFYASMLSNARIFCTIEVALVTYRIPSKARRRFRDSVLLWWRFAGIWLV